MWICDKCSLKFTTRTYLLAHNCVNEPSCSFSTLFEVQPKSNNIGAHVGSTRNKKKTDRITQSQNIEECVVDDKMNRGSFAAVEPSVIFDELLLSSDHSDYVPSEDEISSDNESSGSLDKFMAVRQPSLQKNVLTHDYTINHPNNSTNISNLDGMETFPVVTNRPRKRIRNEDSWNRNLRKEKRARGEAYVSSRNKEIAGIVMKEACADTCRQKCHTKFSYEERLSIFNRYYALANYNRQRDFIHSNTLKYTKKKKKNNYGFIFKAQQLNMFYLPSSGERIKVCKTMFLNTLGIKKGVVDVAMKKRTAENTAVEDRRGKHVKKVTQPLVLENVKSHIQSFPTVPSHYCRSTSNRKYLQPYLNISIMYKMYCELRDEKSEEKVSPAMYRNIFNEHYNLGCHRPKKDQCRVCAHYDNASTTERDTLKINHQVHLALKDEARSQKMMDRIEATNSNGTHVCANFDLQQVLLVPTDPKNNALFYKRRLATYNFNIYNVVNSQGDCFMWDETEGARGSCEIASSLFRYLKSLPAITNHVTFFSDRCGGQNLNQFTAAMFMKAVQETENIDLIDFKFLVSGHSEMECDSMHSAISSEFKRIGKALWPEDWKQIARGARRKGDKPYHIHDLHRNEIIDFKTFVKENLTVRKKDENSQSVFWQKMCWLRFKKSLPYKMEFKETYDGVFRCLDFGKRSRRASQTPLQPLHQNPIPISRKKYQDLISLFNTKPQALGDAYKPFYLNLPHDDADLSSDADDEPEDDDEAEGNE